MILECHGALYVEEAIAGKRVLQPYGWTGDFIQCECESHRKVADEPDVLPSELRWWRDEHNELWCCAGSVRASGRKWRLVVRVADEAWCWQVHRAVQGCLLERMRHAHVALQVGEDVETWLPFCAEGCEARAAAVRRVRGTDPTGEIFRDGDWRVVML